ncbi:MAG: hypothetical protein ACLR3C_07835 [Eggerthella lenta]
MGLGDGACGHRVPADHGERDTLGRAGGVQSWLPSLPLLVLALVGFAAFLGTLLGAASDGVRLPARARTRSAQAGTCCGFRLRSRIWFSPWARSAISSASIQLGTVGHGSPPTWSNLAISVRDGRAGEEGS